MCGRYQVLDEDQLLEIKEIIEEVERKINHTPLEGKMRLGEIYPTNAAPVVAGSGAELMVWGMPQYNRTGVNINARSETAAEKPTFARALSERRIAVPTSGFFEWTHDERGKSKDKFLFLPEGEKMMYLAGIYTVYTMEDGTKEPRYVIMTTDANESMSPYHDRMPVYLAPGEVDAWIKDRGATRDIIHRKQPMLHAVRADGVKKEAKPEPEQMRLF